MKCYVVLSMELVSKPDAENAIIAGQKKIPEQCKRIDFFSWTWFLKEGRVKGSHQGLQFIFNWIGF